MIWYKQGWRWGTGHTTGPSKTYPIDSATVKQTNKKYHCTKEGEALEEDQRYSAKCSQIPTSKGLKDEFDPNSIQINCNDSRKFSLDTFILLCTVEVV